MDVPLIESEASQLGRAANDTNVGTTNPGTLYGGKIHLGQSNLAIDQQTTYAELSAQEADYDGYAATAVVWGLPATAQDNTVESLTVAIIFKPTGDTTENTVYNLWFSNAGSSAWYFAATIPGGPYPMSDELDEMVIILRFRPATGSIAVVVA